MLRIFILFLFLAAAVWLGIHLQADTGYVLIAYRTWTMEMPIWFAIVAILILFALSYFLIRAFHHISSLPVYITQKFHIFQLKRSYKNSAQGLLALAEGDWKKAEKRLKKAMSYHKKNDLINYLAAALAAESQNANTRAEAYLLQAQLHYPTNKFTIELARAQLEIKQQHYQQALLILLPLHHENPSHPRVILLLKNIYEHLQDWERLAALIYPLKKYNLITATELQNLISKTYSGMLENAAQSEELQLLQNTWLKFPSQIRKDPELIKTYVLLLIKHNASNDAEAILRTTLKKHWNNALIALYGQTIAENPKKQLRLAEQWLSLHPNNPALLLALGRICKYNQLWGKSKTYLKNSLAIEPRTETYFELAKLAEKLNDEKEATEYLRQGFLFAYSREK